MKPLLPPNPGPFEVKSGSKNLSERREARIARRMSLHETNSNYGTNQSSRGTVVSLDERRKGGSSSSRPPAAPVDDLNEDDSHPAAEPPERKYDCEHYETCLDLAASLNWASFTCGGCSGEVNSALLWRAHQNQRKDSVAKALCDLKPIQKVSGLKCSVETSVDKNDQPLASSGDVAANVDGPLEPKR